MVGKYKFMILFIAVISLTCLVLEFAVTNAEACAQDTTTAKSKGYCPPGKCKDSPACAHKDKCIHSPACAKRDNCNKGGCNKIDELLNLTRCAKKELLKEKIKANLDKKIGTKLDKVADLLVEAMLDEYRSAMQGKARKSELQNKIRNVFTQKDTGQ
ncbi:MAG: hypothetical protein ACYSR1_09970 [Planctomycetota bacterium]|jgi:hypothetical protein